MSTDFIEKSFSDLSRDDLHSMRRKYPVIKIENILSHYLIDITEYREKIEDVGLRITSDERKLIQEYNKRNSKRTSVEQLLTKKEMMAVRMFRGFNRVDMAKKLMTSELVVRKYELSKDIVALYIQRKYLDILKITDSEMKRIRRALSGEVLRVEEVREIPEMVRQEVYEKYKGLCAECGSDKNHHIHHKTKFSDGGLHTVTNLVLLCVSCHAEAHKDDREYRLLKSIAEKLSGGERIGRTQTEEVCV